MKTDLATEPCHVPYTGSKLYPAETHCHTRETGPCGRVPAEYLVRAYLEEKYRYLFITDHMHEANLEKAELLDKPGSDCVDSYLAGYLTAKAAAAGTELKVLLGMEVTLKGRSPVDFLVFG